MNPVGKRGGPPDNPATPQQQHTLRCCAGVIQNDCLIGETDSFRSTRQTSAVSSPYVGVRDVVAAHGRSQSHSLDMQLWIPQGNVDQMRTISGFHGIAHDRHRAMARQSALQNEALVADQERSTPLDRLAGCGDCSARRPLLVEIPRDGVRVYPVLDAVEYSGRRKSALARSVRPSHQRQRGHTTRLWLSVREARRGESHADGRHPNGSHSAFRRASPLHTGRLCR